MAFKIIKETKHNIFLIVMVPSNKKYFSFFDDKLEVVRQFEFEQNHAYYDAIISLTHEEFSRIVKYNVNGYKTYIDFKPEKYQYKIESIIETGKDIYKGLTSFSPKQYFLNLLFEVAYSKNTDATFYVPSCHNLGLKYKEEIVKSIILNFFDIKDFKNYHIPSDAVYNLQHYFFEEILYCDSSRIEVIKNEIRNFIHLISLTINQINQEQDDGILVSKYERRVDTIKKTILKKVEKLEAECLEHFIDEDDMDLLKQKIANLKSSIERMKY